jgi:hypothetical protein
MVVFSSGFETNDFTEWTGSGGSPTVQEVIKHTDLYAMECTAKPYYVNQDLASELSDFFMRFYLYFDSLPASDVITILDLYDSTYGYQDSLRVSTTGWIFSISGYGNATYTNAVTTGVWYCVEVEINKTGTVKLWINGVNQINQAIDARDTGTQHVYLGEVGATGANVTCYFDCVAMDSAYIGTESSGATYSPSTRSSLPNTMIQMLNSKMLFG